MQRRKDAKTQSKKHAMPQRIRASLHLFTICYLIFTFTSMPVCALEFDPSLDDEIRKNYNPNKIEEDMQLPALPRVLKEPASDPIEPTVKPKPNITPISRASVEFQKAPQIQAKVQTQNQVQEQVKTHQNQQTAKLSTESYTTLKLGTKIRVKLLTNISDRTKRGTRISLMSTYPVSTTYFTIPTGTVFKGEIISTHKPQWTANGGLIKMKIDTVIISGQAQSIDACVTKANHKFIFLNNIKGKRRYLASMFKSTKPGFHFCGKMLRVSGYLASDGSSIFVAPFSLLLGLLTAAGNVVISPALAVFYKGGSIALNEGTDIQIRLRQDMYIYK